MKKKLASIVAISIIATNTMPAMNVFADEIIRNKTTMHNKESKQKYDGGDFQNKEL